MSKLQPTVADAGSGGWHPKPATKWLSSSARIKAQYRRTRSELFPVLSRIQNIGYDLGENNRSPEWYRANHRTPWVAGQVASGAFLWGVAPVVGDELTGA